MANWSVSVSAARVRGKDEDRVQFPDGPLQQKNGALVQREDAWFAPRQSGFDSPTLHLHRGLMAKWDGASSAGWPNPWGRGEFDSRWVH
jgi:hypothetical protein